MIKIGSFKRTRVTVTLMLVALLLAAAPASAATVTHTHSWSDGPIDFYHQTKLVDEGGGDYHVFTKVDLFSDTENNFYIVKNRRWSREACNYLLETDTKTTHSYYNSDPSPNWGIEGQTDDGYGTNFWSCTEIQAIMYDGGAIYYNLSLYDGSLGIDDEHSTFLCLDVRAGGFCP